MIHLHATVIKERKINLAMMPHHLPVEAKVNDLDLDHDPQGSIPSVAAKIVGHLRQQGSFCDIRQGLGSDNRVGQNRQALAS
jgi:hypothetical protein